MAPLEYVDGSHVHAKKCSIETAPDALECCCVMVLPGGMTAFHFVLPTCQCTYSLALLQYTCAHSLTAHMRTGKA